MSLHESLVNAEFDSMEHARRVAPPAKPAPTAPSKSRCASLCVSLVLLINTACLVAVLVAVLGARSRVEATLDKVDQIIDEVHSGKPSAGTLQTTNTILSSAAGYFFLGSFDGTITGYLQNLFLYDFVGMAQDLKGFATNVESVFADVNSSSHGEERAFLTGARAVKSIAGAVASAFQNVQGATVAPDQAAMSEGIFRLDGALQFVRSQASAPAWKDAAGICKQFVASMNAVQWYGSWVDADGTTRDWNINSDMHTVLTRVNDICVRLARLQ